MLIRFQADPSAANNVRLTHSDGVQVVHLMSLDRMLHPPPVSGCKKAPFPLSLQIAPRSLFLSPQMQNTPMHIAAVTGDVRV